MAEVAHTEVGHGDAHDDHHEQSFWSKYVFSTDHKMIGIQSLITKYAHKVKYQPGCEH